MTKAPTNRAMPANTFSAVSMMLMNVPTRSSISIAKSAPVIASSWVSTPWVGEVTSPASIAASRLAASWSSLTPSAASTTIWSTSEVPNTVRAPSKLNASTCPPKSLSDTLSIWPTTVYSWSSGIGSTRT